MLCFLDGLPQKVLVVHLCGQDVCFDLREHIDGVTGLCVGRLPGCGVEVVGVP